MYQRKYLKTEPAYHDQCSNVWPYAEWTRGEGKTYGSDASDEGIDLVAKTHGTGDYHAIQCKFHDLYQAYSVVAALV